MAAILEPHQTETQILKGLGDDLDYNLLYIASQLSSGRSLFHLSKPHFVQRCKTSRVP
jgi:hypothetical protein